jgi:hypothetical protein
MAWHAILVLSGQLRRKPGSFDPRRLHPLNLWAREVRQRVVQAGQAETLVGDDLRRALRLLSNHRDIEKKISGGITAIIVKPTGGTGGFFLRRKDGSEDSFSVAKCLGLEPPRAPPPGWSRRRPQSEAA